jgi:Zn-dependent protease/CBS domain-containing protein
MTPFLTRCRPLRSSRLSGATLTAFIIAAAAYAAVSETLARMGSSVRLGRIAGIEFGVNWSWLVVFALIVWTLASGIFPSTNPGLSKPTHIAMAVVAAFLFFLSILLHEFGHALQARREGIEIDGITLWLFGGVARFKGSFRSAGAEFRVAIAGPLVSLALGVLFVLIALINGLSSAVDGVAAWLGYINLTLLVFNLIPAPPLDGGRVLHAALWRWRGDFVWATRVGANVGRAFGYLLIAGGLAMFIFQSSFSGAWLAFLGWFLLNAATAEARYLLTQQALSGLRVGDVMTPNPVVVSPDTTLGEFMDKIVLSQRHTTYPVVDDDKPVGLLPFRCVASVPRGEWDVRRVRDCLISLDKVPVLGEVKDAVDALAELSQSAGGHGLVVSNGGLAGIISTSDLARALEARRSRGAPTRV